jgi:hypothetical protein
LELLLAEGQQALALVSAQWVERRNEKRGGVHLWRVRGLAKPEPLTELDGNQLWWAELMGE